MYVRRTLTRSLDTGEHYYSHRLVRSERAGGRVRQVTLLNLGRDFPLAPDQWPRLCTRIEEILRGLATPTAWECETAVEGEAQRLAARLLARQAEPRQGARNGAGPLESVDIDSLELVRARTAGVEQVALWAATELRLAETLQTLGVAQRQVLVALGMIVGRMALPGTEQASRAWWTRQSALGELLGVDFATFSPLVRCRAEDSLQRRRRDLEVRIFARLRELFALPDTVPLYDLTHTCFADEPGRRAPRRPGYPEQTRGRRPAMTLGLVLDGSGFVRRSACFAGQGADAPGLGTILEGLEAPPGALVAMEQGVASAANLAWLRAHDFRYLLVSRAPAPRPDPGRTSDTDGSCATLDLRKAIDAHGQEASLYCHSPGLQAKEDAQAARRSARLEAGLNRLAEGISKPGGERRLDRLQERIARLRERSGPVGQHYRVELAPDASGEHAAGLVWERLARPGSPSSPPLPGVCCLRSSETDWDAERMWGAYVALADLRQILEELGFQAGIGAERPSAECDDAHLLVSVLAYQCVQTILRSLKGKGIDLRWSALRRALSNQCRVTASVRLGDGRTLHLRTATRAEPEQLLVYRALGLDPVPGSVEKTTV